ncbi:hypothetical protein [Agromyces sp. Marseille-Q5079]|uniref:hypothetical protein n=1 Tax=Agromyces sp. Marseille-Q5079 TaxID=3439059 RepID=UPI003D9CB4DE
MTATHPSTEPLVDATSGPPAAPATGPKTPWYRRLWVLITGGALLVLLSFTGGFAVGSASSILNGLLGVPSGTQGSFEGGAGQFPGDGQPPQGGPGQGGPGVPQDQQSGTDDGTNS